MNVCHEARLPLSSSPSDGVHCRSSTHAMLHGVDEHPRHGRRGRVEEHRVGRRVHATAVCTMSSSAEEVRGAKR